MLFQSDATTNNTVTRLATLLSGDDRTSYALDWIKLDWGYDFGTSGTFVVMLLVRERVGAAAINEESELVNNAVWWDAKHNIGDPAAGFFIMSDTETYVNFLPDEQFDLNQDEQLSLYVQTRGAAGSNQVEWNVMLKVQEIKTQIIYPNDNAYFDNTFDESVQDMYEGTLSEDEGL